MWNLLDVVHPFRTFISYRIIDTDIMLQDFIKSRKHSAFLCILIFPLYDNHMEMRETHNNLNNISKGITPPLPYFSSVSSFQIDRAGFVLVYG